MKLQNKVICLLIFVFVLVASGCTSQSSEVKDSTNAGVTETPSAGVTESTNMDVVYTQSPSEIVLTTGDLPEGWYKSSNIISIQGENASGGESASSSFYRASGSTAYTVSCQVNKYYSVSEAKSEYQTMYNTATKSTSVGHPIIGEEAYSRIDPSGIIRTTVFRKGNIIVEVSCYYENSDGGARIIEGKITR